LSGGAHRRLNPLTGEWVLVSPHRLSRPWQGANDPPQPFSTIAYDPDCYLCPGNARAAGAANPAYAGVYIFDNDFAALTEVSDHAGADGLLQSAPETGVCRVICYAPEHHLTMARLVTDQITAVVAAWAEQTAELAARDDIAAVTIFENRGAMMGASNPHPHGQIWASGSVPNELATENELMRAHFAKAGAPLLEHVLAEELARNERVVCENGHFVALVPFWAAWPFETLVLPRRGVSDVMALTPAERAGLADILRRLTIRYDNLFQCSFPYTMGVHQRPFVGTDGGEHFTLHLHFYPPLLRSASVRKFMVGFEMLGMPQRDLTPEAAAERLRACSEVHYVDGA
jgi:UDPglucose--hexose-1-phosphate uridylyltransferase